MHLRSYFNSRKYLGSGERSSISDKVYNLVRYEYLLSHLIRSKPFDLQKEYHFNEQMEKEMEYKIDMLFSSEFYNAIDNHSLPKYFPLNPDFYGRRRTNCNCHSMQAV
jgi:hypothetical protein